MANCKFDWSICQTCANAGSNLCPLENNRTIKELKDSIKNLENKMDDLEGETDDLEGRVDDLEDELESKGSGNQF